MITAWAAKGPKQKLERYEYDPGEIGPEEVRSRSIIVGSATPTSPSSTMIGAFRPTRPYPVRGYRSRCGDGAAGEGCESR
jgi:hypothetical protein